MALLDHAWDCRNNQKDVGEEADEDTVPACLVPTKLGIGEVSAQQRRAVGKEGEENSKRLSCLQTQA